MAEEAVVEEEKAKKPWLVIIGVVFGVVILTVGTVVGTLLATGFFDKEDPLEAELSQLEQENEKLKTLRVLHQN
jgi:flagellar FliL protein